MPTKQHPEPLTVNLTQRQRRRLDSVIRKHGLNLETFLTRWTMAAVASLESKRSKTVTTEG